jgi:hypothetical protein
MKNSIVFTVLGFALVASAQAELPQDISLDGYCDGITGLTVTNGFVKGTYDATHCSGVPVTVPIFGVTGKKLASAHSRGASLTLESYEHWSGAYFHWIIRENGTWTIYVDNGGSDSGTWTARAPGSQAGSRRSSKKSALDSMPAHR